MSRPLRSGLFHLKSSPNSIDSRDKAQNKHSNQSPRSNLWKSCIERQSQKHAAKNCTYKFIADPTIPCVTRIFWRWEMRRSSPPNASFQFIELCVLSVADHANARNSEAARKLG